MATATAKKTPPYQIVTRTFKDGRTSHWYMVDGKTAKGRGVTTILGNGLPAGGLMVWAANTAASCALDEREVWEPLANRSRDAAYEYLRKAHERDRDEAGNRGTEVHHLAEKLMAGEEVEPPDVIAGHVDQFIAWFEEWQPEIVMVEAVGANLTHNYYGKFDFLARVNGWPGVEDRPALILGDIKTSRSGPFEKDALQLAAYRHFETIALPDEKGNCWDPQPMPEVDGCAVLQLSADSHRFIPVNEDLDRALFAQFLHCAKTAEFLGSGWRIEDRGWSREVLLDPVTPGGAS